MSDHTFFEENDYFFWTFAAELPNGKWEAFVFFERKSDHQEVVVKSVKHRIKREFDSRNDAMSAATDLGYDLASRDATQIDEVGGNVVGNG
jgi:hypothetical protein